MQSGIKLEKADPFGKRCEASPKMLRSWGCVCRVLLICTREHIVMVLILQERKQPFASAREPARWGVYHSGINIRLSD